MSISPTGIGNDATSTLGDLTVVSSFEPLLTANGIDSLEALFSVRDGEQLAKPGLDRWRERFRLRLTHDGETTVCYLKRFSDPPGSTAREVRHSGSGARSIAGMEWTWMRRLAADGIATVRPIAFGEEVIGTRERRSAILSLAVPGRSLEAWMEEWGDPNRATLRGLLEPTARLVALFHAAGYVHRDLYAAHLFFDPGAATAEPLHLIDVQRIFRPGPRIRRWIVKDLGALNYSCPARLVTRADRLRWLKLYLGISMLNAPAKRLAYRIIGKTHTIAAHDRRRKARTGIGAALAENR